MPEDDPRITGSDITFPGADGAEIMPYLAMPSSEDSWFETYVKNASVAATPT